MKIFVACVLLAVVLAEPPVDNRYLPPQQGLSPPSQSYGFPGSGGQRQTDAFLRPRPSYGAPAVNQRPSGRRPSNQYIPPQSPSNQYGPPRNQYLPPSNQYAAPRNQYESNRNAPPSNQYIPPSNQYAPPSNQYIPPSNRNAPPSNQYIPPSNQYAPPSNQYIPPSNQYIPPPNRAEPFGTYNGGPDSAETRNSGENLYPKADTRGIDGFIELNEAAAIGNYPQRGGYAGDDEVNNKPANYNFEYKVKDEPSGNDFGHRESRQGNRANGLYYVVLPDGRKQMVEYVADEEGYKPKISYEDVGAYANNARNGFEADGPY